MNLSSCYHADRTYTYSPLFRFSPPPLLPSYLLLLYSSFLLFSPSYDRKEKARKVEFDFDAIQVLGLKFDLPKGGAAKIGAKSGLGSDSNEDLVEKGTYVNYRFEPL